MGNIYTKYLELVDSVVESPSWSLGLVIVLVALVLLLMLVHALGNRRRLRECRFLKHFAVVLSSLTKQLDCHHMDAFNAVSLENSLQMKGEPEGEDAMKGFPDAKLASDSLLTIFRRFYLEINSLKNRLKDKDKEIEDNLKNTSQLRENIAQIQADLESKEAELGKSSRELQSRSEQIVRLNTLLHELQKAIEARSKKAVACIVESGKIGTYLVQTEMAQKITEANPGELVRIGEHEFIVCLFVFEGRRVFGSAQGMGPLFYFDSIKTGRSALVLMEKQGEVSLSELYQQYATTKKDKE